MGSSCLCCPGCTNIKGGTEVYRCKNPECGSFYCHSCSRWNGACPRCGRTFWFPRRIGRVVDGDVSAIVQLGRLVRSR